MVQCRMRGSRCVCCIVVIRWLKQKISRAFSYWVETVGGSFNMYGSEGPSGGCFSDGEFPWKNPNCPQCALHSLCGVSTLLCSRIYDLRRCWCLTCGPPQIPGRNEVVRNPVRLRSFPSTADDMSDLHTEGCPRTCSCSVCRMRRRHIQEGLDIEATPQRHAS